jgi:O-antigen/teichoic acid export membrane protein
MICRRQPRTAPFPSPKMNIHVSERMLTMRVGRSLRAQLWRSPRLLIGHVRNDSLLRNSFFIMMTTVINSVFGFVFWLVAAHLFAASVVGLSAALVSAITIVALLASLGVSGMLIQSMPSEKGTEAWSVTFWAGIIIAVVLSLALACVTIIALPFFARDLAVLREGSYAALFAIATTATTAGVVLDVVFIAERSAGNMFVRNTIAAVSKFLVVVLFMLVAGANGLNLLSAWTGASVIGLGVGAFLLIRRMRPLRPARPSTLGRAALGHRSRLAGNQLIGMGGALLPYVVPLLVTERLSTSDNAYFYTTWMMAGIFLIVSPSVSLSLFAEGAHSPRELLGKARSALEVIGAIIVPCLIAIFFLGGLMLSAFGPAYEHHGVGLLRIVLIASIPDAINNVYVALLRVQGRLAVGATLNVGMGLGIVVLSWIFLPSLGISAVGWAFLVMQLCGCVFVVVDLRRTAIADREDGVSDASEKSDA